MDNYIAVTKHQDVDRFVEALYNTSTVEGLTHTFYRYPARFSPLFAREAIKSFTEPGDVVLDPFMGGGTTIVEARILGRRAIGVDISELAYFITNVKTTIFFKEDLSRVLEWAEKIVPTITLSNQVSYNIINDKIGISCNLSDRKLWPIRKLFELLMSSLLKLKNNAQIDLARCALLRTGQWALDSNRAIPSVSDFRSHLINDVRKIVSSSISFSDQARSVDYLYSYYPPFKTILLNRSIIGIENNEIIKKYRPKLILTSPPYPGIHVLYHRWQICGRRESNLPFLITNTNDGKGSSYYTFGSRKEKDLKGYYENLYYSFASLRKIVDTETLIIQLVAFSDPEKQLKRYLSAINQTGFKEIKSNEILKTKEKRLWRNIPNRKWYVSNKTNVSSNQEVVLFHRAM